MSRNELERSGVIRMVVEKRLKQREGARRLGLKSTRQIRRLVKEYRQHGPKGLVSKHRGKPGNHRINDEILAQARTLLEERYPDFGPTLAHDWFEGRAPACRLIVFIDDATSRLLYLRFVPAETTEAYMEGLRCHLGRYGRPVSFYSDRHSIFRVNTGDNDELTQFGRAVKTLWVTVCEDFIGNAAILYKGRRLEPEFDST